MQNFTPHSATLRLLRYQALAKLSRTLSRFRGPRRLILSVLAMLLAAVWIMQVAASVLYREAADAEKLAVWIPVGLMAYALWHLLKTACRTPIEPFEWTGAERELLGAAPLRRGDLVTYRLISIAMAAVAKAACFSLVMLPDLPIWAAGFAGMLLALLFIDLIRMAMEIVVYGLSRREFVRFRTIVLGIAILCVSIGLMDTFPMPDEAVASNLPASVVIGVRAVDSLMNLRNTGIGMMAEAPFELFSNVILASGMSLTLLARLLLAAVLVMGLAAAVVRLDLYFEHRRVRAERDAFKRHGCRVLPAGETERRKQTPVFVPVRLRGAGTLAWRQALGAMRHPTSLCVAMVVPGFLSCLILLTPHRGPMMLMQMTAGLVFYSFLLLPTAFKFDFRRDVNRLAMLKRLPLSSTAVTAGQLAVPVFLCTLFQLFVLLVGLAVHPYHPGLLVAALMVLVPTNILIFSFENLIFLLYPYRLNQEGLTVFFRSILTFTGKGLLFAGALAIVLLWALAARYVSVPMQSRPDGPWNAAGAIFVAGLWILVTAAAVATTALLSRVYGRFDPSQDTPGA